MAVRQGVEAERDQSRKLDSEMPCRGLGERRRGVRAGVFRTKSTEFSDA